MQVNRCVTVTLSVNKLGLNSSVVRGLAQYARGPGFESKLRLDISPPVTFVAKFLDIVLHATI